tara:strand:- start:5227 stop:6147 length:921 start_codon:yes stop_codon:yes gene_type:complete
MSKNYYKTLDVASNDDASVIKKAYRKLSMKHHPDRGGNGEIFKDVNDAYQVLGDPEKRRVYDMQRNNPFGGMRGMGGINPMDAMGMQDDILKMFFGGDNMPFNMGNARMHVFHNGRQMNFNGIQKPTPIIKTINITLDQAFTGIDYPLELERWCQEGNMKKVEKEKIYITIRSGIDDNEIIIIRNKGNIINENLKGDIKIFVKITNNTSFKRQGLDLFFTQKITLKDALTGFTFELKHLSGKTYVINNSDGKIIQPGYKKVIPNMGMIRTRAHPAPPLKGRLVILFEICFPQNITEENRLKLKELL